MRIDSAINPAGVGTKILDKLRFEYLLSLVNVKRVTGVEDVAETKVGGAKRDDSHDDDEVIKAKELGMTVAHFVRGLAGLFQSSCDGLRAMAAVPDSWSSRDDRVKFKDWDACLEN